MLRVIGGSAAASITYTAPLVRAVADNSHTFSGVAFGDAAADRIMAVLVFQVSSFNLNSINALSIGGVTATQRQGGSQWQLWTAPVPTGTTGDVVWTSTGPISSGNIIFNGSLHRLTGVSEAPYDTDATAFGASPFNLSINTATNGLVLAGANEASTGAGTYTWGGILSDADEVIDDNTSVSGNAHGVAQAAGTSAGTGQTITITESGGRSGYAFAASWR